MKTLFPLILILFSASTFAQTTDFATATRAKNGKLVSLTNILGLSDCSTKDFAGEVRNIQKDSNIVYFELWEPKETDNTFEIIKQKIRGRKPIKDKIRVEVSLTRIAPADRQRLYSDMIRKSFTLRVAGYVCGTSDMVSAFSLDLVY
jgi:hypothetical protein